MSVAKDKEQEIQSAGEDRASAAKNNQIRYVIGVMSGKGGVGKSFITGLLASALAKEGYQVGVLDGDITGPSIPMLFGLHGPVGVDEQGILPLESRSGIKVISMNLILESEDQPVVWRGPLIGKAIKQLWEDVAWGALDYLLIDLPPGTSDAALTIMQSLPVNGVVMVTTPQRLSAMIVSKAVHMAQKIGVPITGVVENMAYYRCPDTGKKHYIYGKCHGESVALKAKAPILAQVPLDPNVAELCDAGRIEDVELDERNDLLETFLEALTPQDAGDATNTSLTTEPGQDKETAPGRPDKRPIPVITPIEERDPAEEVDFSPQVLQLIENRENMGYFDDPDARAIFQGCCGDSMQIDLRLDGDRIQEARFLVDGCGATIACGSMLTRMIRSKTLDEASQITPEDLLDSLGGLPDFHRHCADLTVRTLREVLKNAVENRG